MSDSRCRDRRTCKVERLEVRELAEMLDACISNAAALKRDSAQFWKMPKLLYLFVFSKGTDIVDGAIRTDPSDSGSRVRERANRAHRLYIFECLEFP